MTERIKSLIPAACSWRNTLRLYDTVSSTNTLARALADEGAPHGTVLLAEAQTGGRGRMGRSFDSRPGKGIYMSVLLRPECPPEKLMHLTCAVAVAVSDAVQAHCALRPDVKWINDLMLDGRKLGGILTELCIDPVSGLVTAAIIGIGLNCSHTLSDFPPELQHTAISLETATAAPVDRAVLTAGIITSLWRMDSRLHTDRADIMRSYRAGCITLGRDVRVLRGDEVRCGTALTVDDSGALTVAFDDGTTGTVTSGEVTVRGLNGYI